MKPSLHELISNHVIEYCGNMSKEAGDLLAEQIIKIVRDYHLVEDDNYRTVADDLETIRDGGE
jgi:hypothetical protein